MVDIQKMITSTFVNSDPRKFHFVGSVSEVTLARVSIYSQIMQIYRKFPEFRERAIPSSLQVVIKASSIPKRDGVKRKAQTVAKVQPTKAKIPKNQKSKKAKPTIVNKEWDVDTLSDVCIREDILAGDITMNESKISYPTP